MFFLLLLSFENMASSKLTSEIVENVCLFVFSLSLVVSFKYVFTYSISLMQ